MEDQASVTPPKKRGCIFYGLVGLGLLLILFIAAAILSDPKSSSERASPDAGASTNKVAAPAAADPDAGVTMANFKKVSAGMTYPQVVAIFGTEGELISSGDTGGTKDEIYQWGSPLFGGVAIVAFIDGKVLSTNQTGLS